MDKMYVQRVRFISVLEGNTNEAEIQAVMNEMANERMRVVQVVPRLSSVSGGPVLTTGLWLFFVPE